MSRVVDLMFVKLATRTVNKPDFARAVLLTEHGTSAGVGSVSVEDVGQVEVGERQGQRNGAYCI